jgi:hypothetical protein
MDYSQIPQFPDNQERSPARTCSKLMSLLLAAGAACSFICVNEFVWRLRSWYRHSLDEAGEGGLVLAVMPGGFMCLLIVLAFITLIIAVVRNPYK